MRRKQKKPQRAKRRVCYPAEVKVQAVKLHLEEGYSAEMVAQELGVGRSSLSGWVKRYREEGPAGLEPRRARTGRRQVASAAKAKAIELKRQKPEMGSRKISHILRRFFFLKAAPETVRQTLKKEGLLRPPPRKKPKRNPGKPRFFERAKPNQMWQTDIFCFRLGGRTAYVIGYMDDYSRYMVGAGLFRSQTAEHVIEVFRRAMGEYGVPKEMLTDNGRQYVNWRGTTRFEKELKKERIKHIRSQPHHPMTLGKIERFWKTLFGEFLSRVQFESFEEAEARLALWVKYYNHKRPHQGIGGLCPADRFFEIQNELRDAVERGIAENVLETALRGTPSKPFYMVGRMGEQSVVIRAEKGKVKMLVDGKEDKQDEELIYNVNERETRSEHSETDEETPDSETTQGVPGESEVRSGAEPLVGAAEACGDQPGAGNPLPAADELAGPGDGRDAGAAGAAEEAGAAGLGQPPSETAGEDGEEGAEQREAVPSAGEPEPGENTLRRRLSEAVALLPDEEAAILLELVESRKGEDEQRETIPAGPETGGGDPEGPIRTDHRQPGGRRAGGEPEDLLQVGETGPAGPAEEPAGAGAWPPDGGGGPGAGSLEQTRGGAGAGAPAARAQ